MPSPQSLRVNLSERSYPISIGFDHLERDLVDFVETVSADHSRTGTISRVFVVTDTHVESLYGDRVSELLAQRWPTDLIVIPAGEESKCVEMLSQVWSSLFAGEGDRSSVIVAVGGGVVGDLSGFAASTFNRGIGFIQIPTTLLAQVDSSVGGKTAIDLDYGKNIIGTFYQPWGVLIDIHTLHTLDDRQYRSGLAEVVKYGLIMDEPFFAYMEQHIDEINRRQPDVLSRIVERCCELKAQVVQSDEQELTGARAILNYGHTFGHAIEAYGEFQRWLHGEAVAMGMAEAAEYAVHIGLMTRHNADRQNALMTALNLDIQWPEGLNANIALKWMAHDKKTVGGNLRLVLPRHIGCCELVKQISQQNLEDFLNRSR